MHAAATADPPPLPGAPPDLPVDELVRLDQEQGEHGTAAHPPTLAELAIPRADLEARFTRAIASLHMVYQPVVSWRRRETFAYEALLRSRERTLERPEVLLRVAERLQRIGELGRAVRAHIARTIESAPPRATFLVNVDAFELLDRTLYAPHAPLTRHADRVILEITERAAIDSVAGARARVDRLRRLGFRIAVDDLGSGYADLALVALLEPDLVKLDRSLITRVESAPARQRLVRWLATLCRDQRLDLIAEGVETRREREMLVNLGCDLFQGHLFARPGAPFPRVAWA